MQIVECTGSHYEMGQQQGAARRSDLTASLERGVLEFAGLAGGRRERQILAVASPTLSVIGRAGKRFIGRDVQAHYPDQYERMRGIAAGAEVALHRLFLAPAIEIVLNRTIYAMPPAGACSAVAITGDRSATGEPVIAKNFDYPRAGLETYLARHSRPRGGARSLDVTHSPLAGSHEGINEHGLAVTYNYGSFRGRPAARVSITTLVQELLERCATVDEAVALLRVRPRSGGALLMLADASGELASVELAPDTIAVRRASALIHTNHALTRDMAARDVPPQAVFPRWWRPREIAGTRVRASSERRLERAEKMVEEAGSLGERDLLAMMSDHAGGGGDDFSICRHGPYYATTCSVLLFPARRTMKLVFGAPCAEPYTELSL